MLPRRNRLTATADFTAVVRGGVRAGSSAVVVHLLVRGDHGDARVGFVVNRAVGPAVRRNQVKRRLRQLAARRLSELAGTDVVIRATPSVAGKDFDGLRTQLDDCLRRALSRSRPHVAPLSEGSSRRHIAAAGR